MATREKKKGVMQIRVRSTGQWVPMLKHLPFRSRAPTAGEYAAAALLAWTGSPCRPKGGRWTDEGGESDHLQQKPPSTPPKKRLIGLSLSIKQLLLMENNQLKREKK
jgi:hypothetical protein